MLDEVRGAGQPGAEIMLCIESGGTTLFCGDTVVNQEGTWGISIPSLADGEYVISARQRTALCISEAATSHFTSACQTCTLMTFETPFPGTTVCAPLTEITGSAPPDAMMNVIVSGPGGTFSASTIVETSHRWSVTIPALTVPGIYQVTASVVSGPCQQTDSMSFTLEECV